MCIFSRESNTRKKFDVFKENVDSEQKLLMMPYIYIEGAVQLNIEGCGLLIHPFFLAPSHPHLHSPLQSLPHPSRASIILFSIFTQLRVLISIHDLTTSKSRTKHSSQSTRRSEPSSQSTLRSAPPSRLARKSTF